LGYDSKARHESQTRSNAFSLRAQSPVHCIVQWQCCAVLCYAVPCYAVLCYAVLCCAVLCCAVLCCAVLCCAVLRCTALRCAVMRCVMCLATAPHHTTLPRLCSEVAPHRIAPQCSALHCLTASCCFLRLTSPCDV
jgi:hypothetical protein